MAWENCLENLRVSLAPKQVLDMDTIDWKQVNQDALDNDGFKKGDPYYLACQGRHCTENVNQTPQEHALCQCKDINGKPLPDCKPPSFLYPFNASVCVNIETKEFNSKSGRSCTKQGDSWYQLTCYCCCSCFAYGTQIGIPEGSKAIEQFSIGDQVLTANVTAHGDGVNLSWTPATVSFSSGTGPDGYQPTMVFIRHGGAGSIIVTPDHLFLMPNGKLKRANRLVPGVDFLVSAEGVPVEINEVSLGEYRGGVHHIATDKEFSGEISGHLLISEGIVSGDFNLQIHAAALKEAFFVDDHDELPTIGQPEYEQANTELLSDEYTSFLLMAGDDDEKKIVPHTRKFYVHGKHTTVIPNDAASYLSQAQAVDVGNNAPKYDFSEVGIGYATVSYALKLFQGFYPDIVFHHDVGRMETNAYAFEQYGKQVVVITGGMTRIKGLGLEGIVTILAHMIARLQKIQPQDELGYTSVAMADYYSTSVLRNVFFGNMYVTTFESGIKQIAELVLDSIDEENDAYEGDPFAPTREVRIDSITAGNTMNFPPEEAGGPVLEGLEVTAATAVLPVLTPRHFVTDDISEEMAEEVYQSLVAAKVLSEEGELTAEVSVDTDLSALFSEQSEGLKRLLTEEVRYILLHATSTVSVTFNLPLSTGTAFDPKAFLISPEAKVKFVRLGEDTNTLLISASLQKEVEYTVTVPRILKSDNGSTLNPDKKTATFTLA